MKNQFMTQQTSNDQQSVSYYSDLEGTNDPILKARRRYNSQHYPHMLLKDIQHRILPVYSLKRRERNPHKVELEPANGVFEELIIKGLEQNNYGSNLGDALQNFMERCVYLLTAYGEAYFEIVYFSVPESEIPIGFEIVSIQPMTLKREKTKFVQYLPKDVAEGRSVEQFVDIDPLKILHFEIPMSLRKELRLILELLSLIDIKKNEKYHSSILNGDLKAAGYDFKSHMDSELIAIANITRNIGWAAGFRFQDETVEFYHLYRRIQFEKFILGLRGIILETLNDGLRKIGQRINHAGSVRLSGFLSHDEVNEMQTLFLSGDISFKETLDKLGY